LRNARRAARAFLQNENPDFRVSRSALRAEEEDRFVFAVFYTSPEKIVKPTPYKLVAVHRSDLKAEMIHPSLESDYWFHGRRWTRSKPLVWRKGDGGLLYCFCFLCIEANLWNGLPSLRWPDALRLYSRAVALSPDEPKYLAALAEAKYYLYLMKSARRNFQNLQNYPEWRDHSVKRLKQIKNWLADWSHRHLLI